MTIPGVALLLFCCGAILGGSRRIVPIVFLFGCLYLTTGQRIVLADVNLPAFRILLILGLLRMMVRGERPHGGVNSIDRAIVLMSAWLGVSSFFQPFEEGSGPKYIFGEILSILGSYYIFRTFLNDASDRIRFMTWTLIFLIPLSLEMISEQVINRNLFSAFGGVPEIPLFRDGKIRAQGPFPHAILAGTIGAMFVPFAASMWRESRKIAIVGGGACLAMIITSASSGPIMSLLCALFGLFMWRYREYCRYIVWGALASYPALAVVMNRPPYHLITYIDITGGSTSYYRAFLIDQAIAHLDEWWLLGTDVTRHWMPAWQPGISDKMIDITSTYIAAGVMGGALYLILLLNVIRLAFDRVGRATKIHYSCPSTAFRHWCLGSSLLTIVFSGFSVAFFGQAQVLFWLPIGAIGAIETVSATSERSSDVLQGEPRVL
jgi:hypothetical protein